jgi:alpha-methylacyl-CoA racemase
MTGPLAGLRVVELVGQGPGPYCGMLLADLGADVVAVVRPAEARAAADRLDRPATNPLMRGKRSVVADLKDEGGVASVLALLDRADVFIDPFRPGVCERLGLGPDVACERNPRLIYGRMTGWGQEGPWAQAAGHDIDYIALSGALSMIGYEGQPPTMPINLLGDFAGGGLLLTMGIAAAAFERSVSGRGQVIDAAMVDGAALILGPFFSAASSGFWGPRGTNQLDGGAHFYNVYETSDAEWIAVGAIEPQFYAAFLAGLGLPADTPQWDQATWPELKEQVAAVVRTRTRDEWCEVFEGTDACVAPVLAPGEVPSHPHTAARGTVVELNGVPQPQAAPRFSRTPAVATPPCHPGQHALPDILADWA